MKILQKLLSFFKPSPTDPVHNCEVYKKDGCAHVDGPLCDIKTCDILDVLRLEKCFYIKHIPKNDLPTNCSQVK